MIDTHRFREDSGLESIKDPELRRAVADRIRARDVHTETVARFASDDPWAAEAPEVAITRLELDHHERVVGRLERMRKLVPVVEHIPETLSECARLRMWSRCMDRLYPYIVGCGRAAELHAQCASYVGYDPHSATLAMSYEDLTSRLVAYDASKEEERRIA